MDNPINTTTLIARVKAILLTPKDEWAKVAGETATTQGLLIGYALPLALIGPVARFIGGQVFGYGAFGFSWHPPLMAGLATMVVSFVLGLVMIYVLSLIVDFLAPHFGGEANRMQALKLAVYGATASWVSGIFGLVPAMTILGLLGLYSLYLYFLGATPLMKVPEDKAAGFTAVTIICAIVLAIIVTPITAALVGLFSFGGIGPY